MKFNFGPLEIEMVLKVRASWGTGGKRRNSEASKGAPVMSLTTPDAHYVATGTFEDTIGTDPSEDLDGVAHWQDEQGSYDVTQSTVGLRPIYKVSQFGSEPGVDYDLDTHELSSSPTVGPQVTFSGSITIFIAGNNLCANPDQHPHLSCQQSGGDEKGWWVQCLGDGNIYFQKGSTSSVRVRASYTPPSVNGVAAIRSTGNLASGIDFWHDGVSQTRITNIDLLSSGTTTNSEPLLVGANNNSQSPNSTYAEIRIYTQALTDDEIVTVSNNLVTKYGF